MLQFDLLTTDPTSHARRGTLTLNHGVVQTPIFMPVGTYGTVKGVMPQSLHDMGAQIILGNTFHLWMRPGQDVMQSFGGLHGFEKWDKPILTDSGGFQVWSLGAMRKITEEGVHFASPVNGDKLFMSPEVSMQIQTTLNSDIVMQLDECTPYETKGHLTTEAEARKSMEMSLRWARRSQDEFARLENPNALFGIVQGGMFENLRAESLERLVEMDFPGYAVDGMDGLAKLRQDPGIKLIVCDVNMPNMDGLTMAEKVRGELRNTSVNIVMLTTENSPTMKERGKAAGIRGWIVKPFNGAAVLNTFKTLAGV